MLVVIIGMVVENIIKFMDPRVMRLQNVIVILLACISTIIGMITMVSASTYISTIPPGACNPTCNHMGNSAIKVKVDWKKSPSVFVCTGFEHWCSMLFVYFIDH